MTWTLVHTIERQSSSSTKIVREWSDSEIEEAAQEIQRRMLDVKANNPYDTEEQAADMLSNYAHMLDVAKPFLPDPIKDAL